MELLEAIQNRKSIRKFKPQAVPRPMLEEILQAALRAPSSINTQPWECWVVGGETLQRLGRELYAEGAKGVHSRGDFTNPETWKDTYMNRMRENGKGLFGLLGIDRQDKEKRKAFTLSMHKYFRRPPGDLSLSRFQPGGLFDFRLRLFHPERLPSGCIERPGDVHSAVRRATTRISSASMYPSPRKRKSSLPLPSVIRMRRRWSISSGATASPWKRLSIGRTWANRQITPVTHPGSWCHQSSVFRGIGDQIPGTHPESF